MTFGGLRWVAVFLDFRRLTFGGLRLASVGFGTGFGTGRKAAPQFRLPKAGQCPRECSSPRLFPACVDVRPEHRVQGRGMKLVAPAHSGIRELVHHGGLPRVLRPDTSGAPPTAFPRHDAQTSRRRSFPLTSFSPIPYGRMSVRCASATVGRRPWEYPLPQAACISARAPCPTARPFKGPGGGCQSESSRRCDSGGSAPGPRRRTSAGCGATTSSTAAAIPPHSARTTSPGS
jgi:hypothetical protein